MKKKGILIGVLSVLMLMAFTACEQNTPSSPLYGAQVENITVASQPVYICIPSGSVQDTIDPSVLSFEVKYNDGKVYTYTGAQLGLEASDVQGSATVNALTKTITIDWDNDKTVDFYVPVKAYYPTAASINLSSVKDQPVAITSGSDATFDVAVNLTSAGGAKEFTYSFTADNSDVSKIIKDNELEAGDTFDITAEYATTLSKDLIDDLKAAGIDCTYTGSLSVVVADPSASKVASITAKQTVAIYAKLDGMTNGKTTLKDAAIEVTAYDEDGNVLSGDDITGFTASYYDERGVKFNAEYAWTKAGTYAITVKYTKGTETYEYDMNLVVSNDYPVTYTLAVANTEAYDDVSEEYTKPHQFKLNEEILPKYFTFTPDDWKSGATYASGKAPEYTAPTWTAVPGKIPSDVELAGAEGSKTGSFSDYVFETTIDGKLYQLVGKQVTVAEKPDYSN